MQSSKFLLEQIGITQQISFIYLQYDSLKLLAIHFSEICTITLLNPCVCTRIFEVFCNCLFCSHKFLFIRTEAAGDNPSLIDTIESDSDSITSSEVSSDDDTESDTFSIYGTEDDSTKSGDLHSLDNTDITQCLTKPRFLFRTAGDSST